MINVGIDIYKPNFIKLNCVQYLPNKTEIPKEQVVAWYSVHPQLDSSFQDNRLSKSVVDK